ncbi:HAD family hydrolase [Roseateles toxinivorans]|uniref:HAD superfamily hydrolase (TIGR01490 family) n=1 Tax=Roseateles toxinivorans TaxID=270368 RepID=A0A4R6QIX0_9BURK|nr:HAD family hydrolase [Roseateles toxinivorans]TDP63067.1 HAD superfamily hydrolase (TIGR01490 family) [Roseateles toxinivorans]
MNLTLFDLDGTLIPTDSDHAFGQFMVDIGWTDGERWARRNDEFYAQYQAGRLDLDAYVDFATSVWRARAPSEYLAARRRFMAEVMEPAMHDNARSLVRDHQQAGDLVAIVTATNEFVTEPIAEAFAVPHLIAVELERLAEVDGHAPYTGAVRGVPSYQAGKITRVQDWLRAQGRRWEDFERITFYSDSINDLPLLERVSHPVATNPTPALEHIARERGWTILKLFA